MTPTPEQIAAMEARGWAWDERRFRAKSSPADSRGEYRICLMVLAYEEGWRVSFGWTGAGFNKMRRHPDPLTAADEAEAWLRGVLSGFRFPWLTVNP